MSEHLPPHSLLECLRPDPGWRTDTAVLSTYSLDLYVAVAILLALGGVVDDAGSAAAHELAATLDGLLGRVRIVAQQARITAPSDFPHGLGILDRFVETRGLDEKKASWHAKLAFVRYVDDQSGEVAWRCWIGSRNFTAASNWDLGVLLCGSLGTGEGRVEVDGIAEAYRRLIAQLDTPLPGEEVLAAEIQNAGWSIPIEPAAEGPSTFRLMLPGDPDRGYPRELERVFDRLYLVSPFLDEPTVRAACRWGGADCPRVLVSTLGALQEVAGAAPTDLQRLGEIRVRDSVSEEQPDASEGMGLDAEESDDALQELSGLHAKFIMARRGERQVLWLGSPNLTGRAWERNAEAVIRLEVDPRSWDALKKFLDGARPMTLREIQAEPAEEETELERARRELSAISDLYQERDGDRFAVYSECLGELAGRFEVSVAHVTAGPQRLIRWPPRHTPVRLPANESPAAETQLLRVRLEAGGDQEECILFAPLRPPPGEARDRAAVAALLRPSGFKRWLAELLEAGAIGTLEGETWERQLSRSRGPSPRGGAFVGGLTLEEILRAWTRDPARLSAARERTDRYLNDVLELVEDDESEEAEELRQFQEIWRVVSSRLGQGGG